MFRYFLHHSYYFKFLLDHLYNQLPSQKCLFLSLDIKYFSPTFHSRSQIVKFANIITLYTCI